MSAASSTGSSGSTPSGLQQHHQHMAAGESDKFNGRFIYFHHNFVNRVPVAMIYLIKYVNDKLFDDEGDSQYSTPSYLRATNKNSVKRMQT